MPSVFKTFVLAIWAVCLQLPGTGYASTPYMNDTRAYNLAHGRVVFNEHCLGCHESGRKGAPVISEPADWSERLEQPLDAMIKNAVHGHGDMPARGDTELATPEIADAVAYVVDRARLVISQQLEALPASSAGQEDTAALASQAETTPPKAVDDAVMNMFLLLIGKERWR